MGSDLDSDNSQDLVDDKNRKKSLRHSTSVMPGQTLEDLIDEDNAPTRTRSFDDQDLLKPRKSTKQQAPTGFFGALVQGLDDATFMPEINEFREEDE